MEEGPGLGAVINRPNFLNKLCFAKYGAGLDKHGASLKADLFDYLESLSGKPISRQTIVNWFDRKSGPGRTEAQAFAEDYIQARIDYESLDSERKAVVAQLRRFLKRSSGFNSPDKVHLSSKGSISIEVDARVERTLWLADSWVGTYVCYKMRFSEERDRPIAREVLRIFRRLRELRFEQWYRRRGGEVDRFEGVVAPLHNLVWLIGTSRSEPERLRVQCFHRNTDIVAPERRYRWGLVVSDIPYDPTKEPSASRIVLMPVQEAVDFGNFAQEQVAHLAVDGIPLAIRSTIMRLIDNHVSAFSTPGSIEPAVGGDGMPIPDLVLRIDQKTMDAALNALRIVQGGSTDS